MSLLNVLLIYIPPCHKCEVGLAELWTLYVPQDERTTNAFGKMKSSFIKSKAGRKGVDIHSHCGWNWSIIITITGWIIAIIVFTYFVEKMQWPWLYQHIRFDHWQGYPTRCILSIICLTWTPILYLKLCNEMLFSYARICMVISGFIQQASWFYHDMVVWYVVCIWDCAYMCIYIYTYI